METVIQVALSGLTTGAIYAVIGVSYNIIFGAAGILNFPQGAFMMSGAMMAAWLYDEHGWSPVLALIVAMLVGALLGAIEERIAVRPATSKGHAIGWVVATFGFAIVLQAGYALALGPDTRIVKPIVSNSPHHIGGAVFSYQQLLIIGVAVVVGVALHQFYRRTRIGWALTAIAKDPEAAAIWGFPFNTIGLAAFAFSAALAGMIGFFAAPLTGADPSMGFSYTLSGFVAATVGGIPNIGGAVIGGFALGLLDAIVVHQFGAPYQNAFVFGVLAVVLMTRPNGLFGRSAARVV
jgi:branched-chain amino acid transport system permease protein